jgi:hypothetical protein
MDMQDEGFMLIATACGRILPDPATLEMQVPGGANGKAGGPALHHCLKRWPPGTDKTGILGFWKTWPSCLFFSGDQLP